FDPVVVVVQSVDIVANPIFGATNIQLLSTGVGRRSEAPSHARVISGSAVEPGNDLRVVEEVSSFNRQVTHELVLNDFGDIGVVGLDDGCGGSNLDGLGDFSHAEGNVDSACGSVLQRDGGRESVGESLATDLDLIMARDQVGKLVGPGIIGGRSPGRTGVLIGEGHARPGDYGLLRIGDGANNGAGDHYLSEQPGGYKNDPSKQQPLAVALHTLLLAQTRCPGCLKADPSTSARPGRVSI